MAAKNNLWWFSGNTQERTKKLAETISAFKTNYPDAEVHYYGNDVAYAYLEHQILSTACFSDHRMVVINELPQFASSKQTMMNNLKKLLGNLPEHCAVVFNGIDPDDEKALSTIVAKEGMIHHFPTVLSKGEAAQWVVDEFFKCGKVITSTDASVLVGLSGYDKSLKGIGVNQLRLSIKKIVCYVGKKKNVSKEDIDITAYPTNDWQYQYIIDAINSRDIEKCQRMFHRMVSEDDDMNKTIRVFLAAVVVHYKLLFLLKEGEAKKLTKTQINQDIMGFVKYNASGHGFKRRMTDRPDEGVVREPLKPLFLDWVVSKAYDQLKLYTRRDLGKIIKAVEFCSVALAQSHSDVSRMLLVDIIFLTICTAGDDELLRRAIP